MRLKLANSEQITDDLIMAHIVDMLVFMLSIRAYKMGDPRDKRSDLLTSLAKS